MNKKEREFVNTLWTFYNDNARSMPWRAPESDGTFDPYKILVSEMMLQQTQVSRVTTKYVEFLKRFPNVKTLSQASLSDVLQIWSGLGYNRRAKYLHEAAKYIESNGYPASIEELTELKGIGKNTAAAIFTYTFNQPHVFVETNVRTVCIYHFFQDRDDVDDKEILAKLEATIDRDNPREFMWAIMDYGTFLKKNGNRSAVKSKHYTKQSTFSGSIRQMRGELLRRAHNKPNLTDLQREINDHRFDTALNALLDEKLVAIAQNRLIIP